MKHIIMLFVLLAMLIFISCNRKCSLLSVEDNGRSYTAQRIIEIKSAMLLKNGSDEIIEQRYEGIMPAAETEGISYDLTLWNNTCSESGIFELDMTFQNFENGKNAVYRLYGEWHAHRIMRNEKESIMYHLIPENSNKYFSTDFNVNFIYKTDSLIVFDQSHEWFTFNPGKKNYILKLLQ